MIFLVFVTGWFTGLPSILKGAFHGFSLSDCKIIGVLGGACIIFMRYDNVRLLYIYLSETELRLSMQSTNTHHAQRRKRHQCSPSNSDVLQNSQSSTHPHLDSLPRIQLRPDIQIKAQHLPLGIFLPRIKINYIFQLGPTPIHDPIMPIKRRCISQQGIQSRLWRHSLRMPREGMQPWSTTSKIHQSTR